MSSLRNAVKRKEHKERSQPEFRKKLGLLEKKKDYKERAVDYHKKEKTIKHLKHIAGGKNPDEFYFGMQNSGTKDGVHVVDTADAQRYTQEELALMRTQDIGYLRTRAQAEAQRVARMKGALHFIGLARPRNHTLFVDDEDEAEAFDPAQHFDTPAELLGRTFNRPRTAQLAQANLLPERAAAIVGNDKVARRLHASYTELAQRQKRHTQVGDLAARMSLKQALAGKGRKRKMGQSETGSTAPVYKWKKERKK